MEDDAGYESGAGSAVEDGVGPACGGDEAMDAEEREDDSPRTQLIKANIRVVGPGRGMVGRAAGAGAGPLELCRGSGPDPLDTFAVGCTCTALPALWDRSGLPAPLQATSIHYCLLQMQVESIPIQECIDGQRRAATGANNRSGYRGVRRVSAEGCCRRMRLFRSHLCGRD